jgi:UDP-N-acetylglucosamine 2-epimerase (non-hydrolysing)
MNVLTIIGTRPEAVKMAPVLLALAARPEVRSLIASTGQHPDLLDGPLRFFGLAADKDLRLMRAGEAPRALVARTTEALKPLIQAARPDRVIVQGDTASALAGARAAALAGVKVSHVEAGLRTYGHLPWPEEAFRTEIDGIADQLFAPTLRAARNLADERVSGSVHITGNSGIDALRLVVERLASDGTLRATCDAVLPRSPSGLPLILATLHRRESKGPGAAELSAALLDLADAGLAEVAVPLHPNGALAPARAALDSHRHISLLPPLDLATMVRLMQRADLILTDSGGIQEEAPTLGTPVLVLREVTARPEAVEQGLATLVGLCRHRILAAAQAILGHRRLKTPAHPYGDGQAAGRIVATLLGEPFVAFGEAGRAPSASPLQSACG